MYIYLFNKQWWKLISLFGFALQGGRWEAPKSMRCGGHVWGPAEFYYLRDSAQKKNFNVFQQHTTQQSLLLFFIAPLPISIAKFSTNTHQSLLLLHLHTQPPLHSVLHLHSTFSQHSMHIVHWFSTSSWVQYIWISLGIWCYLLLWSARMNWMGNFVVLCFS
jgi:hypothetical protein